jgi:hypothetical protein
VASPPGWHAWESRPATLFIGWFGPGLASVVFGLLIVEELPDPRP